MKIWVDADACPAAIRDIVLRAAVKRSIRTIFVANKQLQLPQSELIERVQVGGAPDEADQYIEKHSQPGDLVITQDVPLAASLVNNGVCTMSPRGVLFREDNIADLLSRRDLLSELRDIGVVSTSTPPLDATAVRQFANQFDSLVQRLSKKVD